MGALAELLRCSTPPSIRGKLRYFYSILVFSRRLEGTVSSDLFKVYNKNILYMPTRYNWKDIDSQNRDLVDAEQKPALRLYAHDGCYCVTWPSEISVPRFVEVLEDLDRRGLFVPRNSPKSSRALFGNENGIYDESFEEDEALFRYLRENADKVGPFLRIDMTRTSYTRDFVPFKPTTVGAVNGNEVEPNNIFELMRQTAEPFDENVIDILRDAIKLPPPTAPSSR